MIGGMLQARWRTTGENFGEAMAQPLKDLSLNIQTFEDLRKDNFIYVDKTKIIYELVKKKSTYFLSRPRRFGKSLLLSTLEAIFLGRKELFEGLAISQTDYTWPVHPVIRFDFGTIPHATADELKFGLCNKILLIARDYNVVIDQFESPQIMLESLIIVLSKKNKVVVLVDEYDKPILDHINDFEKARAIQSVLKSFYEIIKSLDAYIRFILLTGVSKFTKTAVFSGLNNLNDISEKAVSAHLLGYTQEEILNYFGGYLEPAAQHMKTTVEQLLINLKTWYDGYWFSKEPVSERLYAPLSVMYFLQDKRFDNYWFTSGTPSHLVELLKLGNYDLSALDEPMSLAIGNEAFDSCDLSDISLEALLYQTGYLTIQSSDPATLTAILNYPNKEVRDSMRILLISMRSGVSSVRIRPVVNDIKNGFLKQNVPLVISGLQIMFAQIPSMNHIDDESYYHSLLQMILITIGFRVDSESNTHTGRPDLVVDTGKEIFVIELKLNKSPELALDQIAKKRYFEKYQIEHKPITLVGINFEYKNKRFSVGYVAEKLAGS